jgi:MacB-like periplasmic core domain
MSWLLRDFHFGMRESARRPGFTALAILTLALGIGSVTAMYSVIYNVLLNPFPYAEPRRMVDVIIQDTAQTSGGIRGGLSVPEFRAYVDESNVFEEAVGTETSLKQRRTERHGTEDIVVGAATPNLFHFLGVKPLLGRVSAEEDAKPGASPVAVLSYQAWMASFGGNPATLGHTIVVDDQTRTIIGIMPPHFAWNTADIWVPDRVDRSDPKPMERAFWLQGRLNHGISLQQAQAELNVVAGRFAASGTVSEEVHDQSLDSHRLVGREISRRTLHLVWGGRPTPADRLLQCSKHVVSTRHRTRKRDRDSCGTRRHTLPGAAPTARRKLAAVSWRGSGWGVVRLRRCQGACPFHAAIHDSG